MRERFFISITDDRHVRQYAVNRYVGRVLMVVLSGHTLLFVVGFLGLFWLAGEIDALRYAKESLITTYRAAVIEKDRKREAVQAEMGKLERQIQAKREELNIINRVAQPVPIKASFPASLFAPGGKNATLPGLLPEVSVPFGAPTAVMPLSSGFGMRDHPLYKKPLFHYGLDFETPVNTPVFATADGVVEYVKESSGYGRLVTLRHALNFRTAYAHLQSAAVQPGQVVSKGEVIAYTGNSGVSTAPHLHYEILYSGHPLDPAPFIRRTPSYPIHQARSESWDSSHASRIQ